jgi:hypothetical protein
VKFSSSRSFGEKSGGVQFGNTYKYFGQDIAIRARGVDILDSGRECGRVPTLVHLFAEGDGRVFFECREQILVCELECHAAEPEIGLSLVAVTEVGFVAIQAIDQHLHCLRRFVVESHVSVLGFLDRACQFAVPQSRSQ